MRFFEFVPFWDTKPAFGRCRILLGGLLADTGPTGSIHGICLLCTSRKRWSSLGLFSEFAGITFPTYEKVAKKFKGFLAINSDSLVSADFHPPEDSSWSTLGFKQFITQEKVEVKPMRGNSAVDRGVLQVWVLAMNYSLKVYGAMMRQLQSSKSLRRDSSVTKTVNRGQLIQHISRNGTEQPLCNHMYKSDGYSTALNLVPVQIENLEFTPHSHRLPRS